MAIRRRITTSGNSAALVLSQDILGLMGVSAGDEVDITMVNRTLVVRPVAEVERGRKVAAGIERVFAEHGELMERLAEGAGARPKRRGRRARR